MENLPPLMDTLFGTLPSPEHILPQTGLCFGHVAAVCSGVGFQVFVVAVVVVAVCFHSGDDLTSPLPPPKGEKK